MIHSKPILVAGVLVLSLAGCESKEASQHDRELEQKADLLENQADVIREQGEAQADWIERQDPGFNDRTTERAADANRALAEKRADQLENEAEHVRDGK